MSVLITDGIQFCDPSPPLKWSEVTVIAGGGGYHGDKSLARRLPDGKAALKKALENYESGQDEKIGHASVFYKPVELVITPSGWRLFGLKAGARYRSLSK